MQLVIIIHSLLGTPLNPFAFAVVVGLKYKIRFLNNLRLSYPLLVFAILVGFSRIYIGIHYPLDVLFGAIIGATCAIIILKLENKIIRLKTRGNECDK